ncbi:MAG: sulfite exporter TauE/SafE family protein [Thermoanaerobaculia bacterium]
MTLALLAVLVIAFLYSAVGHAGASGYIAVLTLLGFASTDIRPTALLLNILVAILGAVQFARAGYFRWNLFWPFALLAVPAAFIGGSLAVPRSVLNPILAAVLLFSAVRLVMRKRDPDVVRPPAKPAAVAVGAAIGFLSGITGTGGGIFLTPLLLFFRWSTTRTAAAVSVVFILVNSMAGLAGYAWSRQPMPAIAWPLAIAAVAGGAVGSFLGSRKLPLRAIYIMLATVLCIAGVKLLLT